jgi:hypothetical protein
MDEHDRDSLRAVEFRQCVEKIQVDIIRGCCSFNVNQDNASRPATMTTSGALTDAEQVAHGVRHAHELPATMPSPGHRVSERFTAHLSAVPCDKRRT